MNPFRAFAVELKDYEQVLTQNRLTIMYAPELVVYHSGWRDDTDNQQRKFDYAFGSAALAGYYLRVGFLRPSLYLTGNFFQKLRRLMLGIVLCQNHRITDGYIHVSGYIRGFFKGLGKSGQRILQAPKNKTLVSDYYTFDESLRMLVRSLATDPVATA